jgi:phosphoribosylglycinamide formyltransferase-1
MVNFEQTPENRRKSPSPTTRAEFVSEPLTPVAGTADTSAMARGEPGLPKSFRWRQREHAVVQVVRTWKSSTPELGEMYLRRHWFEVLTDTGLQLTIYCERQRRSPSRPKSRWWVYSAVYRT